MRQERIYELEAVQIAHEVKNQHPIFALGLPKTSPQLLQKHHRGLRVPEKNETVGVRYIDTLVEYIPGQQRRELPLAEVLYNRNLGFPIINPRDCPGVIENFREMLHLFQAGAEYQDLRSLGKLGCTLPDQVHNFAVGSGF